MLYCIPVRGWYLTMNGQWVSIRMRPSLRMCSRWPLARISRFLRTRMAKRGFAPLFSCTWRRWRSIDCITETWNAVDLLWVSSSVTRPLPGLHDQTPRPPGCKRFGNHSAWWMREGQHPCLICSHGKPEVSLKSEMGIRCHYLLKCCCGTAHSLLDSWLCFTSCPQPNTNPPTMSLKALKGKKYWQNLGWACVIIIFIICKSVFSSLQHHTVFLMNFSKICCIHWQLMPWKAFREELRG